MSIATQPETCGHELFRFYYPPGRALISVHDDGRVYSRKYGGLTVLAHVAPQDRELSDWLAVWQGLRGEGPAWARYVDELPARAMVSQWKLSGMAMTPSGFMVEIGLAAMDGAPDWITLLGLA